MMQYVPRLVRRYALILCLCLVIFLVFPESTYAQETTNNVGQEIEKYMTLGINLFSWIWIVPASIAGKLMTNDFTYGSAVFMDTYLWRIRTIMRNFSYFTLAFIFIASIISHFVKQKGPSDFWKLLQKVVLAGIFIPMSWFIIAAVVDLSIIATGAVASFPQEIIRDQWNGMSVQITTREKFYVDQWSADQIENEDKTKEKVLELEDIMPTADNVAGPLVFMGAAILKLIDTTKLTSDQGTAAAGDAHTIAISLVIKFVLLLAFIVPLIVLMVVNMIRIFWLWIWIAFSPFIVLDQIFGGPLQKNDKIGKNFKVSNMLGLIFQPVAIVGLISIGLVLLLGVWDILVNPQTTDEKTLQEKLHFCLEDEGTTLGCNTGIADLFVSGGFFQDLGTRLGGFIGEMILLFFAIFLLWSLVKAGFKMSEITTGVADGIYKFAEGMAKAVPIPGTSTSRGAGKKAIDEATKNRSAQTITRQAEPLKGRLNKFFGIDTSHDLDIGMREQIIKEINNGSSASDTAKRMRKAIYKAITESKNGISYNDSFKEVLRHWFSTGKAVEFLKDPRYNILTEEEAKKTPEEIMNMPKFLGFVDHILSHTQGEVPAAWVAKDDVKSLSGKIWGRKN